MAYITVGQENGANIDIYYKGWGRGERSSVSHGWPRSTDDWDAQMLFYTTHADRINADLLAFFKT